VGLAPSQRVTAGLSELLAGLEELGLGDLHWLRGRIAQWLVEYQGTPFTPILTAMEQVRQHLTTHSTCPICGATVRTDRRPAGYMPRCLSAWHDVPDHPEE